MTAMEKGLPVPEIPAALFADIHALAALRSGILLILVGVVLYFAIEQGLDESLALFGLIPAAVGLANLPYATLLWRRKRRVQADR